MTAGRLDLAVSDATDVDAADLAALINAAYRDPGARAGWTDERHLLDGARTSVEMVHRDMVTGRMLVLRLPPEDTIVACLHVAVAGDGAWYLSSIAVSPVRQNAGLGAALLGHVERQARAAGVPSMRMTVIQVRESLVAWYARRGFRRTGASVPFPYDDPRVGRPLRDDLTLVVLEKRL